MANDVPAMVPVRETDLTWAPGDRRLGVVLVDEPASGALECAGAAYTGSGTIGKEESDTTAAG
jgi:hypothetical protein